MTAADENIRATPEDRLHRKGDGAGGFPLRTVLIVAAVAVGAWLLFYPRGTETPPEPVAEAPAPEAAAEAVAEPLPPAADIPPREEEVPPAPVEAVAEKPAPAAPPLPTVEESDPLMREQLATVGAGGPLSGFAEGEDLVQRMVALVDGASRGELLRKILPMKAPAQPFAVQSASGTMYMNESGHDRFDPYVDAVVALDNDQIAASFHQLRPLYEAAYEQLGMPGDELDNAVIRILDRVIAAPVIEKPLALERKSVMYTFADPELEALPGLQKQLLRMGPENTRRLQEKARALRAALLDR